jgi:adenylyltransferase/sulfurtransferase
MLALNPTIFVTALDTMIDGDNIMEFVSRHDVAVDASDNPRTRYLLNNACILSDTPLVSGSAVGTEGQFI